MNEQRNIMNPDDPIQGIRGLLGGALKCSELYNMALAVTRSLLASAYL